MKATVNDVKNFLSDYGFSEFTEFANTFNAVQYDNMVYFINGTEKMPYLRIGQRFIKGKTIKLFKKLVKTYPKVFALGDATIGNNTVIALYINI